MEHKLSNKSFTEMGYKRVKVNDNFNIDESLCLVTTELKLMTKVELFLISNYFNT